MKKVITMIILAAMSTAILAGCGSSRSSSKMSSDERRARENLSKAQEWIKNN